MQETQNYCAGDLVEVRSKAEILSTLDQDGRQEDLPFMPEMLQYCGQRFRVYKRAHKTCDFVTHTGIRKLSNAVHLEGLRCDGSAHGGCQAQCLIFWKEAWLRRVSEQAPSTPLPVAATLWNLDSPTGAASLLTEEALLKSVRAAVPPADDAAPTFVCQATLLPQFTRPLSAWDIRQYVEDYRSGNVTSVWSMAPRWLYRNWDNLINLGIGWGPVLRWLYDRFQSVCGGLPYPARSGNIPAGSKTPSESSNLQPGELVRVKDYRAILDTLDRNSKNRGMGFSAEMVPYCGGAFRVLSRVERIIDERTGKMIEMKNPCLILEGAICQAKYNKKMIFCPRATYAYWREIWLERIPDKNPSRSTGDPGTVGG